MTSYATNNELGWVERDEYKKKIDEIVEKHLTIEINQRFY
jgi:hypothetical protein